jgi:hypothetical protein
MTKNGLAYKLHQRRKCWPQDKGRYEVHGNAASLC